jgi:hypothetical protein
MASVGVRLEAGAESLPLGLLHRILKGTSRYVEDTCKKCTDK